MIIKLDIDGVIRDILTPICELYNKEYKTPTQKEVTPEDFKIYDIDEVLEWAEEQIEPFAYMFFERAEDVFLKKAKLYEDVIEALRIFEELGHNVVFATAQVSEQGKLYTIDFMRKHGLLDYPLFFGDDKTLLKCDIAIDDFNPYLQREGDDVVKVLVERPYNTTVTDCDIKIGGDTPLLDFAKFLKAVGEMKNIKIHKLFKKNG